MANKIIERISIKLKPTEIEGFDSILGNLIKWLIRKKISIQFLISDKDRLDDNLPKSTTKNLTFVDEQIFYKDTELLLSLGGDGTLIGATQLVNSKIPIFGINLGRLGFITEFQKDDFYDDLQAVLNGKFKIKKIPMYDISVFSRNNKLELSKCFINDVVINKNDIARMFHLNLEVNNQHIYNLSGDGLIISSPLGSTAYSLAAGGPIVHSEVESLILTPICPHSLTYRPLILSNSAEIKISTIDTSESINLTIDGQVNYIIKKGSYVTVTKNEKKYISLIQNTQRNYFQVLKEKFFHGK